MTYIKYTIYSGFVLLYHECIIRSMHIFRLLIFFHCSIFLFHNLVCYDVLISFVSMGYQYLGSLLLAMEDLSVTCTDLRTA